MSVVRLTRFARPSGRLTAIVCPDSLRESVRPLATRYNKSPLKGASSYLKRAKSPLIHAPYPHSFPESKARLSALSSCFVIVIPLVGNDEPVEL